MRRAWLFRQCWDVHILQLFFVTSSFCSYALWDLPGDVLAAPASALGVLERCNTLSLSLSLAWELIPLGGGESGAALQQSCLV